MFKPEHFEIFSPRIYPLRAVAATLRLINNKEDTAQVYRVTSALDGPNIELAYQRFISDPAGRAYLEDPVELRDVLKDRDSLRALPENTLGRAYLDFVEGEGLSVDGFQQEMDESGERYLLAGPERQKFIYRTRHTHDLLHVLTGYGRDMIGELCLLAFTRGFTGSRALGLIVGLGQFKAVQVFKGFPVKNMLREGARLGRNAESMLLQPWEELLTMPIEDVRTQLKIDRPEIYLSMKDKATVHDGVYRETLAPVAKAA